LTAADAAHLRATIEVSRTARAKGNEPYGALLVDARGAVLLAAENTQVTDRDCTGHAELNLMREASRRFDAATLAGATVYATGEPCPMCAGAIYWGGIRRVVYALSVESMIALAGPGADEIRLGCRDVLGRGMRPVEVVGPALEDEARRVFEK
jgi:tRNA(Arg) A34 adenosine deaminase TadA